MKIFWENFLTNQGFVRKYREEYFFSFSDEFLGLDMVVLLNSNQVVFMATGPGGCSGNTITHKESLEGPIKWPSCFLNAISNLYRVNLPPDFTFKQTLDLLRSHCQNKNSILTEVVPFLESLGFYKDNRTYVLDRRDIRYQIIIEFSGLGIFVGIKTPDTWDANDFSVGDYGVAFNLFFTELYKSHNMYIKGFSPKVLSRILPYVNICRS